MHMFRFEAFILLRHNNRCFSPVRDNEDPFCCPVDLRSICEKSWNTAFGHLLWWRNEIVGEGKLSGYGLGEGVVVVVVVVVVLLRWNGVIPLPEANSVHVFTLQPTN